MLAYIKKQFSRRVSEDREYLASADGIRFFATIHVIFGHIGVFMGVKNTDPFIFNNFQHLVGLTFANPGIGLEIFFVLSGFLLILPFASYHLTKENKPSLLLYFFRRIIRLELPYLIALTISALALVFIVKKYEFSYLLPRYIASFFYANHYFYGGHPEPLPIAWSLETEVQFYILVPLLSYLFLLQKWVRRTLLLVLIIAVPVLCIYYKIQSRFLFVHYCTYFFAGILTADIYLSKDILKFTSKQINYLTVLWGIVLFVIVPYCVTKMGSNNLYFLPLTIAVFLILVLKYNALPKIFTNIYLRIIGCMCYSIYLWHYMIISKMEIYTLQFKIGNYVIPNLLLQILLIAPIILIVSGLYFKFVERPCMYSTLPKKMVQYFRKK